jgi:hypothetical protein
MSILPDVQTPVCSVVNFTILVSGGRRKDDCRTISNQECWQTGNFILF